jgi:hypothetical protein
MADRLVALLMHSRNQAHTYHLLTNSYAQHKALGKYYYLPNASEAVISNTTQNALNELRGS